MNLFEQIKNYTPIDETEAADQTQMLSFMQRFDNYLSRENAFVHFCASAFVANPARNKAVMVYHNIYDGWIAPGGHADEEADLLSVALREVEEETGLAARPLSEAPFAIQSEAIMGHFKKGKYVPSHLHFNVIFLLEADDSQPLAFRADESKGVDWFSLEQFTDSSLVIPLALRVQKRMVDKLKTLSC